MKAEPIRKRRTELRLSQSELSRRAGVSRYKLNVHEAGGASLNSAELASIEHVLRAEMERLRESLFALEPGA